MTLSCSGGKTEEEKRKEWQDKEQQERDIKHQNRINTLSKIAEPFGATISFDTSNFSKTYEYQELLKTNNIVVVGKFETQDISIKDSTYILFGSTNDMYYELTASKELIDKVKKTLIADEENNNSHYIVAKIADINKLRFKFDSGGESNGDNLPDTWIEVDVSDKFYCKGNLLDFVSVDNIEH